MKRPLRSVMLGNPAYLSSYVLGVAQAMGHLGHWHREVSVLDHLDRVARQLEEMRPDMGTRLQLGIGRPGRERRKGTASRHQQPRIPCNSIRPMSPAGTMGVN